jgi:hypothetical protein
MQESENGTNATSDIALFAAGRRIADRTEVSPYVLAVATGLVVYGIVSGRVTELSGGGLSAKLTTVQILDELLTLQRLRMRPANVHERRS